MDADLQCSEIAPIRPRPFPANQKSRGPAGAPTRGGLIPAAFGLIQMVSIGARMVMTEPTDSAEARRAARKALLAHRRRGAGLEVVPSHMNTKVGSRPLMSVSSDGASDSSEVSGSDHGVVKAISPAEQEKLEDRARKLAARKVRNRLSAEASRKRVRDEMETLSARCGKFTLFLPRRPVLLFPLCDSDRFQLKT